jgi:putative ABC transport system substrate-binding protein
MPVIGYLQAGAPGPSASYLAALRLGLSETGYIEGQNLTIECRWGHGNYDRLTALAADLVRHKVAVIVTGGGPPAALAAKNATSTIPIVFVIGTDPVELGLVASLARPGGNLTGASMLLTELNSKRLELLHELVPQTRVVALRANPDYSGTPEMIREVQEAARAKGLEIHILKARTAAEIDAAFASLAELHAGGLVVGNDTFFDGRRATRGAGIALWRSGDLRLARVRIGRRSDQLRAERCFCLSPGWGLCQPDSRRCQAGRPAGPATDDIRVCH